MFYSELKFSSATTKLFYLERFAIYDTIRYISWEKLWIYVKITSHNHIWHLSLSVTAEQLSSDLGRFLKSAQSGTIYMVYLAVI